MDIRRLFLFLVLIVMVMTGFETQGSAQEPESTLVHGVFTPAPDILESFKTRCVEKGIDFEKFVWIGSQEPFAFTDDPEVVVVLDVTLGDLRSTFEFAWEWAEKEQRSSYRLSLLDSSTDGLRLLQGSEPFQPFTLRWRRVKLNANIGKQPMDVRSVDTPSPGVVLVFVAAQHPARVKATDYEKRFAWFVPGLECRTSDEGGLLWQWVPYVDFSRVNARVDLRTYAYHYGNDRLAVPVFRE